MTVLKTDSLKLYKDKLENYISDSLETATESEVINVFSGPHKYRFEILPSISASGEGYFLLCRLNVEQNKKRLAFENIDYSKRKASKAIINTQQGVCNVSISNDGIYDSGYDYSVAYVLRGDGQCLGTWGGELYKVELDKIANLSSISFFPSWNRYGTRGSEFNNRYSKSVNVKVYCDDEEIFNGEISGLVANDRVYVTFDGHNRCHLEKINVGSASAFANY